MGLEDHAMPSIADTSEDTAVMRALTPQVAPADLLCRSYTKLNEASCSPSALAFSLAACRTLRALYLDILVGVRPSGGHGGVEAGYPRGISKRAQMQGVTGRRMQEEDALSHNIMCCRVLPRALTRGLRGTTTAMPPRAVAFLYVSFDPRVS